MWSSSDALIPALAGHAPALASCVAAFQQGGEPAQISALGSWLLRDTATQALCQQQACHWLDTGQLQAARRLLQAYLQFLPQDLTAWELLARTFEALNWPFYTAQALEPLCRAQPDESGLLTRRAFAWWQLGYHAGLAAYFQQTLQATPPETSHSSAAQRRLAQDRRQRQAQQLLFAYGDPGVDDAQLLTALNHFDPLPRAPRPPITRHAGPLRVGYFSREFGRFSTMQIVEPLLAHHSPAVSCTAYDDTLEPDTARFQPYFSRWRRVRGLSDAEVAAQIRADGIDILVDLGGLLAAERQGIFALHPAPIQISGLGFLFSAGHADMDYCLSDRWLCPPDLAAGFPENVIWLRQLFCWQPPFANPLTAPPHQRKGFLTLGCANGLHKLNPRVLRLWAQLLADLPQSRLHLKTPAFNDPLARQFYQELLAGHGIDPERLQLEGHPDNDHLTRFYSEIDIALDPFPYQGGISTCEALWMGVPVVVLQQPQWRSRALGVSILNSLGRPEWIAKSEKAYREQVLRWAQDSAFLAHCRSHLRRELLASPICQGADFARDVEAVYRRLQGVSAPGRAGG
ncbi:MAG: hypothetical protein ACO1RX_02735 [Candidatus Sericytochromatia bacterium]